MPRALARREKAATTQADAQKHVADKRAVAVAAKLTADERRRDEDREARAERERKSSEAQVEKERLDREHALAMAKQQGELMQAMQQGAQKGQTVQSPPKPSWVNTFGDGPGGLAALLLAANCDSPTAEALATAKYDPERICKLLRKRGLEGLHTALGRLGVELGTIDSIEMALTPD